MYIECNDFFFSLLHEVKYNVECRHPTSIQFSLMGVY